MHWLFSVLKDLKIISWILGDIFTEVYLLNKLEKKTFTVVYSSWHNTCRKEVRLKHKPKLNDKSHKQERRIKKKQQKQWYQDTYVFRQTSPKTYKTKLCISWPIHAITDTDKTNTKRTLKTLSCLAFIVFW